MWNSKSWPDGLPHQKNGAMDSRQTPASSNAREIGVLNSLSFTLMLCRDAAWPVSTDRAILLHWKILGKLTAAKSFSENGDVVSDQRGRPTTGVWTGTKDGLPVWFPVSWRDHLLWSGRSLAGASCARLDSLTTPAREKRAGLGAPARAAVPTFRLVIVGWRRPDFAGAAVRREMLLPPARGRSAAIPAGDRRHRWRRCWCG